MAFSVKYRCEFDTIKDRQIKIDIEEDATISSIINLTAFGDSPLVIEYPNAEFDKLTGIRESKVRLSILGGNGSFAADFLTTSDVQYKVKIYINGTLEWIGWLDNDHLFEPFQDGLFEIKLSASDGLSLLKNRELSDLSDAQLWGLFKVKDIIAYCLDKTDLALNWWSFINMYPVLETGGTLFDVDQRGVDADFDAFYYSNITSFTFLAGPRTFDDCYTVLSKIMEAFCCTLYQARGEWYIVQLNDRIGNDLDGTKRDSTGAAVTTALNQTFQIPIGLSRDQKLANEDALVSWEKLLKDVKISYEYKMPAVYFRNFDLLDGTFVSPLSSATRGVFTLDYWTELQHDTYMAYEKDAITNAELVRYILQFPQAPYGISTSEPAVKTSTYHINKNDRISFSYSTREKNTGFRLGSQGNYVILTDGTTTYRLTKDGKWIIPSSTALGFGSGGVGYTWLSAEDRRFWKHYSIQSVDPAPITGEIYLIFWTAGNSLTASNEVHYKDIEFTITPYYNEKLSVSGYEQSSSQAATLKNNYDNQIFLSNSENIGTQGAILKSTYGQFAGWKYYSADKSTLVPFSRYITRIYWRAVYRNYKKMEGTLFNLYSSRWISPLNTFTFDEITSAEFLPTTLSTDVRNEQSDIRFIELRTTDATTDFTQVGTELTRFVNVQEETFNIIPEEKKPLDWKFGIVGVVVQLIKRNKRRRFNNYS